MDGWMNGFVITLCLMASFVKLLLCKEGKKNHLSPFLLNKYQIRLTSTRFLQQTPKIFGFSLKEQAA